ncbi:alpha/beta fold hydrolase [Rubrivivax sp. RP6-9]|uniref:alpha/beta fold hydrolase n=1 Tax=Rubrivivax sp. RP6-9 TaxID=3415750 RepID=UPI003CC6A3B6
MNAAPVCVEAGQGDTAVLLLHGIGGGAAIWNDALGVLAAAGLHAVALDFPGYGATPGAPTMDGLVGAVAVTVARLGARRTVLVGHSMGGMVAQEFLARGHGGVHALVLACTSPAFGKPDGAWQARFVADRLAPLDAGLGMAGMARALVPAMVAPGAVPGAAERAIAVMAAVPEATYRTALQAIAAFDRRAALPAIAVPTLCLAGAHDRTAPPEVLQRMAQHIPGARFQCLADAGHIANIEQPASFHAALLDFLQPPVV